MKENLHKSILHQAIVDFVSTPKKCSMPHRADCMGQVTSFTSYYFILMKSDTNDLNTCFFSYIYVFY